MRDLRFSVQSRWSRVLLVSAGIACLLASAVMILLTYGQPGHAAGSTLTQWAVAARVSAAGATGKVWFGSGATAGTGYVRRLDPATNTVESWANPGGAIFDGSMVVEPTSGRLYFLEYIERPGLISNAAASLDPATNVLTEWPYRTPSSGSLFSVRPEGTGKVWSGGRYTVTRLDIAASQLTHWALPASLGYPDVTGVLPAPDGTVWLALASATSQIGRLNPSTNEITLWPLGSTGVKRGLYADPAGRPWFLGSNSSGFYNRLYRLDPATNELKTWDLSGVAFDLNSYYLGGDAKVVAAGEVGRSFGVDPSTYGAVRLDPETNVVTKWFTAYEPLHAMADAAGNVWVSMVGYLARITP